MCEQLQLATFVITSPSCVNGTFRLRSVVHVVIIHTVQSPHPCSTVFLPCVGRFKLEPIENGRFHFHFVDFVSVVRFGFQDKELGSFLWNRSKKTTRISLGYMQQGFQEFFQHDNGAYLLTYLIQALGLAQSWLENIRSLIHHFFLSEVSLLCWDSGGNAK